MNTPRAVPGAAGALGLTSGAWLLLVFCLVVLGPLVGGPASFAVGAVLAYGGLGTLTARSVPPPVDARLGLRGMAWRSLPLILCLLPATLLMSEIDNWLAAWLGAGASTLAAGHAAAQALGTLGTLQWALFAVGLLPVVEEFFFRGVLLQGLVAQLGTTRGLLLAAALYALVQASLGAGDAYQVATRVMTAGFSGLLFGGLRLACGSLLAPILLHASMALAGVAATALAARLPIPGFNTGGGHTPLVWLLPSLVAVLVGVVWLSREYARQPPPPEPPAPGASSS